MKRPGLTVLASGRGSNFRAILDAIEAGTLTARVDRLISDQQDAAALSLAAERGVPAEYIAWPRGGRQDFEAAVTQRVEEAGSALIVLAGFMRLLSADFVDRFAGRVLNIHPSLLPAFKGLDAPGQAVAYGVKVSGCTVHLVTADMDAGPILAQVAVPVLEGDTGERLAARILVQEHRLYPATIAAYLAEREARHD
jgi:phosphoribosylglycinamide formyltransferase 1